jgi:hypothetical protein
MEMEEVRQQVQDLLPKGYEVDELSQSPYGAPILFVR